MHKSSLVDNKNKKKKTNGFYRKKTYDSKKVYDNKNLFNFDEEISGIDSKIKKYPSIIKKNLFLENNIHKIQNPFSNRNEIKLKKIKTINIPVFHHCNSITTNTSDGEKEKPMKKVTFSTVEIIRVEKYKKYNALCNFSKNQIKKNMEEVKQNENESSNCIIF